MKIDFFFQKGKHYLARPVNPKGDFKEFKIYCSQSYGYHYEKEKPVFNNGNRMVNIIELKTRLQRLHQVGNQSFYFLAM